MLGWAVKTRPPSGKVLCHKCGVFNRKCVLRIVVSDDLDTEQKVQARKKRKVYAVWSLKNVLV